MCLAEYDGPTADLATVLDDVRTLPFLGPRRVVIVREADRFVGGRKGRGEGESDGGGREPAGRGREFLEQYVSSPCPTGVLILECASFPSNLRLYKRVAELGGCLACDAPKPWTLPQWLSQRCQSEYGKRLDPDAAKCIVDQVGDSLGMLDGELAKLSIYVGSRPNITIDDVEKLVGHDREHKVFGILAAMADGDRATALRLWEEVWQSDKSAEHRAIGGIAYGVRQLLAAHREVQAGASPAGLARRFYTNEQRLAAQLRVFTPDRLRRQLAQLAEADLASKTGGGSVRTSIERFILEHTAARAAQRR